LAVTLERADHRLAKSKTHTKMLISNEAERLVYEPGLAGQKSEVMMGPAPCFAWRGFSLPAAAALCISVTRAAVHFAVTPASNFRNASFRARVTARAPSVPSKRLAMAHVS
jgi:hypothetical protein